MSRPVRVLHVVGGLSRGGIETWLLQILRRIDRSRFQLDFLVHTPRECAYDREVRALGCRLLRCMHPARPWKYGPEFRRLVKANGPYDVVHSHVNHYNGFVLRLAVACGIPKRIAHSHNDTSELDRSAGLVRKLYLRLADYWIERYATGGLGCSGKALVSLFGADWQRDGRWRRLLYSIDLTRFAAPPDDGARRHDLGIPEGAFVIGHVGRFVPQKNHGFLLEVASHVLRRMRNAIFLLVGEGERREETLKKAVDLGIADRVIFTGARDDIPELMTNAMDAFILPSLHEGLGIVLIEAQAAGLPCLFADCVPSEAVLIESLMKRLPLDVGAAAWADALVERANAPVAGARSEALREVARSPFNIQRSIHEFERVYLD